MQGVLTQTMRFSVVIKAFLEAGDDKKGVPNHRKAPPQCTKYAPRLAESPGACIRTCAASIVDMRLAPSECPKGQVTEPARGTPTSNAIFLRGTPHPAPPWRTARRNRDTGRIAPPALFYRHKTCYGPAGCRYLISARGGDSTGAEQHTHGNSPPDSRSTQNHP